MYVCGVHLAYGTVSTGLRMKGAYFFCFSGRHLMMIVNRIFSTENLCFSLDVCFFIN